MGELSFYLGVPAHLLYITLTTTLFVNFWSRRFLHPLNKISWPGVCCLYVMVLLFNTIYGIVYSIFETESPCLVMIFPRTMGFSGVVLFTLAISTAILGRYECAFSVRLLRSNPKAELPFFMRHSAYVFTYRLVVVTLSLWFPWVVAWMLMVVYTPHPTSSCDVSALYPWSFTLAEIMVLLSAAYSVFLWYRLRKYSMGSDSLTFLWQFRLLVAIGSTVSIARLVLQMFTTKHDRYYFLLVFFFDTTPANLVFFVLVGGPLLIQRRLAIAQIESTRNSTSLNIANAKRALGSILCTPEGVCAFSDFLSSEFHSEHLLFFQHCDEFKHMLDPTYIGLL